MPLPTDRGYAVVRQHSDGSVTVDVCGAVTNGQPTNIHARHAQQAAVRIHPAVRLVDAGKYRYTTEVVEVFGGDGAVNIHPSSGIIRPIVD
jgi:hypothetical protein